MDSSLEDGLSASIDENGRLQIIQVLGSTNNTRSGNTETEIAASTIMVLDAGGNESIYTDYRTAQGGMASASIYATHTTYLRAYILDQLVGSTLQCNRMTTVLSIYGSTSPTAMQHYYEGSEVAHVGLEYRSSSLISSPIANQTYTFTPSNTGKFQIGETGGMLTRARIYVGNTYFDVTNVIELSDDLWMNLIS